MSVRMAVFGVLVLAVTQASAIEVYQAKPIEIVQPGPAPKVVQASEPKVARASEPKIVRAPEPKIVAAPVPRTEAEGKQAQGAVEIPSIIFGHPWALRVPGGAWQTENRVEGTRTLHVAPGSGRLPHELSISSGGTYVWKAYGKTIKGRWEQGLRDGYPLTLLSAYEGKQWHVTVNNGELLLWDGNSLAGQFRGR